MPVGRKPKPTRLHVIEGTLNATRHKKRDKEPVPQGELIEPPGWFSEQQREIWAYGLKSAPRGLLKALDQSVYVVWVIACDVHRQAAEQITAAGPAGLLRRTPARFGPKNPKTGKPTRILGAVVEATLVGIMNRQAKIMLKAAAEMGFTPSSRARVTADPYDLAAGSRTDPESEFFGD